MPTININEIVSDIKEYLPDDNVLSDSQLENIANNVIANRIEENDDSNYSEALCKSLEVAAITNNLKYTVDGAGIVKEQVGKVSYQYSEQHQKDVWKNYLKSLPSLCPYLPKGGYNMPTTIGIVVKKGDEIKINSCDDTSSLIL